jgi:steroid delta-isomerase-like uncharacterized protein
MADNVALIRRWFEQVWNQGDESTIDALCGKEAIGYGQAEHGADIHGPEQFKQLWRGFRSAFSEIHVEIHDTIEQGDRVVARWTVTMRHTGPFMGVPATGKVVTVNGTSIQRFAGGKIIAGWDNWDQLGLLVQLGAVPPAKFM